MPDTDRMVITDVRPHVILCPLPKGFWWEAEFIMRLDSCHLRLHHGHWWNADTAVGDTHVCLGVSKRTVDEITASLIDGSYGVWQKYFRAVDSRRQDWIDTANEVGYQIERKSRVRFKLKVIREGSR